MKTIKIYFIGLLVLLIASNCSDDFLEKTPSDQVSSANFFTQEKDVVYALNAAYDVIGFNSWDRNYGSGTDMLRIEVLTDNAVDHHSWNACYELGNGTANAYDWYVQYRWQERYRGIQRANRILEGAEKVEGINEDYLHRLLGEATFLRAYFYFDLVYLFGDVPFITSSIVPEDCSPIVDADGNTTPNPKCSRTDKETIMDQLVIDLETIANDLPVAYESADDKGRVTRGTALTLLARIHLYRQDWVKAAQASKAVMDLNAYEIYPQYANMFHYEGVDCNEVIFDIQVMSDVDEGEFWLPNYGPNSVGGWSCSCPLQSLVDTYETTDGKTIGDPTSIFDPANPYANRDPRLHHSILYPGRDWQGGVYNTIPGATYAKDIIAGDDLEDGTGGQWNKSATGYNWIKYLSQKDIDDANRWDSGIQLILMRYAEVLLMYAEAKVEANDIDQSVYDAINEVRQRADVMMPVITTGKTVDELRDIIRRERRVEFAFEGIRLYDIRRWEIAEQVMPGEAEGLSFTHPESGDEITLSGGNRNFDAAKHYLWPVPQAEIDVSGIAQNNNW